MSEVPRLTELLRDSDEWARVEYFLSWSMEKLALNSPGGDDEISSKLSGVVHQNGPDSGIAIRGLWSICTPGTHHHQYLKLSKDHLSVDGWRFLEVASGAEAVASHDFRSSILNGFKNWKGFMSGKVSMESCGWVNKGNKCGSREIIGVLSNVVVGDSFLVSGEQFPIDEIDLSLDLELSNKFGSLPPIPADYHSAHISEVNGKDTGSHVYFVKNSSQILPMYMVQFTLYEDKEAGNGSRDSTMYTQGICQVCEKQPATIYCVPDKTDMCAKCDRDVHSANKVVRSHQRVPISEKTQYQEEIYGYCTDHKNIEREFFCTICRVPVCVHCKMIGSHSSGSFASHKLTPIQEAYQGIIQIANQEDKLIASKKSQLEKQIALLSEKVDLINKNTKLVEKQIREKADQALKQLEELSWQKMSVVLSEKSDIQRQIDDIDRLKTFMKYQQMTLKPLDFLKSWEQHCKLRDEITANDKVLNRSRSSTIFPDMRLSGDLLVSAEVALRANIHSSITPSIDFEDSTQQFRLSPEQQRKKDGKLLTTRGSSILRNLESSVIQTAGNHRVEEDIDLNANAVNAAQTQSKSPKKVLIGEPSEETDPIDEYNTNHASSSKGGYSATFTPDYLIDSKSKQQAPPINNTVNLKKKFQGKSSPERKSIPSQWSEFWNKGHVDQNKGTSTVESSSLFLAVPKIKPPKFKR